MKTDAEVPEREASTMALWVEELASSARDALERMNTTLTLAEAKAAMVRELIAQRHRGR